MPRARRQPSLPPIGDIGPETPAAMAGCEVRYTRENGKAPARSKFRDHLLAHLAKDRKYWKRVQPAWITGRQRDAGLALHDAWCETERGKGPIKEYVQTSPDWAAIALQNAERIWQFSDVTTHLPRHCRDIVVQVCIQQIEPDGADKAERMADLCEGLTAIADGLRL